MKLLAGITLGITATIAYHRYAPALLWAIFSRGDHT